jgi:hypothetical protein
MQRDCATFSALYTDSLPTAYIHIHVCWHEVTQVLCHLATVENVQILLTLPMYYTSLSVFTENNASYLKEHK